MNDIAGIMISKVFEVSNVINTDIKAEEPELTATQYFLFELVAT